MLKVSDTKEYYLIENTADIEEMLGVLDDVDLVSLDTETTGLNVRKDKIIGYSFSYQEGQGFYVPIYSWKNPTVIETKLGFEVVNSGELINHKIVGTRKLLEKIATKKLIFHNASYDTRIILNNIGIDTLANLHADTMLMQHTLNEEGPFGLKDIAALRAADIGMNKEDVANQEQIELEENVKSKGGSWKKSDKEIYKADLNVLAKYAIADTDLTLRLYNLYSKELEKEGLLDFFYNKEVMPQYTKVTIPMEHQGVNLDMPKLANLITEVEQDITKLEDKIKDEILKSDDGMLFIEKRMEKEIEAKPSGSYAQAVAEYFRLDLPKNDNGKYSLTKKNLDKLPESEAKSFLQGTGKLEPHDDYAVSYSILEKDGDIININSKQQLGMLIFDVMEVEPLSTTDKGSPQFNEEFLEHLVKKNIVSWAEELRVYNKLVKIHGSSYQRFMDEQEDGIYYPYYKQHGTTSGRYSSNLQQLPRPLEAGSENALVEKYTNEIRSLFISPEGYVFIDDDYSSLEPSIFAHDSEDQPLLDIFIKGEDFYSKVAIMALGLTEYSADKKASNFLKNALPQKRQDAKAYSLGIRYGAEAGKISQLLNIDKEDAAIIVDNYFKAFPNLKSKMEDYKNQAKKYGKVKSEFGRVRHLPEAQRIYKKFGDDVLDYQKLKDLSKKHYISFNDMSDIRRKYKNLLNNALNFPIQSAANTVVGRAAIAVTEAFQEKGIDGWVTASVHDQLIFTVNETQKQEAAKIVQYHMENTIKLRVPLIAEPQFAKNFRDGHT